MGLPAPRVVRPGYERIHAKITVKSAASRADLEKLKEVAESESPVKNSLRAVRVHERARRRKVMGGSRPSVLPQGPMTDPSVCRLEQRSFCESSWLCVVGRRA